MKRRVFTIALALSLVLCVVLWARSYSGTDFIRFGWTPHGKADRLIVAACGFSGGQIELAWFDAPKAYTDYLQRAVPVQSSFSGLHLESQVGSIPLMWRSYWFHFDRSHWPVPANADGTIAITAAGAFATNAPRQLPTSAFTIIIPLWLPMLLLAVGPIWQLINLPRRRRRNRIAAGQCLNCGYDLRASPDRCPECGEIAEKHLLPPTRRRIALQFCKKNLTVRPVSLSLAFTLAAISSVLICLFLYQAMFDRHPELLLTRPIVPRYMTCIAFCAVAIISSSVISLLLFDGLRKWLLTPKAPSIH